MQKIMDLEKRKCIYQFILKHPGLHFRELVRKLRIPRSTLSYHIRSLEKRGLIITKHQGVYSRYYIANNLGSFEKKLLHIIRRDTPRNILLQILSYGGGASQIQLSRDLEKHPTTIEFHLKRFLDMNVIEPASINKEGFNIGSQSDPCFVEHPPVGKETIYRLKVPYILIYDLLLVYRKKKVIEDDCFDALVTYMKFVSPGPTNVKRVKTEKGIMERFEKMLYDLFPPFFIT